MNGRHAIREKEQMGIFLSFLLPSGFFKEQKSLSSKCCGLVALILFPVPGMEPPFRLLTHGPCLRIGNPLICIHSLLENMTFISMNHSASRFYLLLNSSCFTAFAAPLPEEHTSSMTTFSRVQLPISRPQPNIAFQAYNF